MVFVMSCSFQRLVFTTAAKMFSSTYKVMVGGEGDAVGYLNPLLAIAATINVSLPGQQPDLRSVHEDSRLLDPRLAHKSGKEGMPGCKPLVHLCFQPKGLFWGYYVGWRGGGGGGRHPRTEGAILNQFVWASWLMQHCTTAWSLVAR